MEWITLLILIISTLILCEHLEKSINKKEAFDVYSRSPDPVYGKQEQHQHQKDDKEQGTKVMRNYPNPSELSIADKVKYMSRYQDDFTITDYKDWLELFRNDQARLPYIHLLNLQKLEQGRPIEVPSRLDLNLEVTGLSKQPPVYAEPSDYFKSKHIGVKYIRKDDRNILESERKLIERLQKPQMLPRSNDLTRLNTEQGAWIPSNVGEYQDTMASDVILWKSGIDNTKKRSEFLNQKVDAYEANYFLQPSVQNGVLERALGRKYREAQENAILSKDEHSEDYHQRSETDNFARPVTITNASY